MLNDYPYIMAPVDGSAEAERALKKAVQLARVNQSQLLIVYVQDNTETTELTRRMKQMKELLESYSAYAKKQHVEVVQIRTIEGSPKQQIAKIIPESESINLIVIGATGRNAFERLMLGSITEYVVRTAPCDVLVVRPSTK
ncbi:universal stress protein [Aerococcus vaginalis]